MKHKNDRTFLREITVGTIIIFIGIIITAVFEEVRTPLFDFVKHVYLVINTKISLPIWIIVLILASALKHLFSKFTIQREPEWLQYTKDTFFGVVWRWEYSGNRIVQPIAYCPEDDTQLTVDRDAILPILNFTCDTCGKDYGEFEEEYSDRVMRQIDQKVRNGPWSEK
jgi:hypothetical protein